MKIKKKNLMILILFIIISIFLSFYLQLQPYIKIQSQAYFHEKVILEIMESVKEIEIPHDLVKYQNQNVSIDTQKLNAWIRFVNNHLNEAMKSEIRAGIPLGYFTGNVFLQTKGPELTTSFLISKKIQTSYDIKTTSLGINNAMIELILQVDCQGHIILGFESIDLSVVHSIPLVMEYVQGEVPQIFPY